MPWTWLIAFAENGRVHLKRLHPLVGKEPLHQRVEIFYFVDLYYGVESRLFQIGVKQLRYGFGFHGIVEWHIESGVSMQARDQGAIVG